MPAAGTPARTRPGVIVADHDPKSLALALLAFAHRAPEHPVAAVRTADELADMLSDATRPGSTPPALLVIDADLPGLGAGGALRHIARGLARGETALVLLTPSGNRQAPAAVDQGSTLRAKPAAAQELRALYEALALEFLVRRDA